ncbi:hypothetical protein AVEN_261498-1 [Araneus ventricosus]|uniref:Uncharacterized protein n=1 Tax=Araneus ventricosus TaxID=182803 RepID=A0A4Y2U3J7_ARAVE|nr:hypothetical protein AVEN_261498-1 [Araneus ventricosus]
MVYDTPVTSVMDQIDMIMDATACFHDTPTQFKEVRESLSRRCEHALQWVEQISNIFSDLNMFFNKIMLKPLPKSLLSADLQWVCEYSPLAVTDRVSGKKIENKSSLSWFDIPTTFRDTLHLCKTIKTYGNKK